MRLLSRLLQAMNSKSPPFYLIVDYQKKIFYVVTREQYETTRDEFISTLHLMSKMKKPFSEILDSLFPPLGVGSYSSTTSLGSLPVSLTRTNERSWIESLRNLNYSQRNFDSALLRYLMSMMMGRREV